MATRSEAAVGGTSPATWVVGVIVALCAVLLLKWLAVVALVAGGVLAFVRWARGGRVRDDDPADDPSDGGPFDDVRAVVVPRPAPSPDDCTWCGLADGHRDARGRLIRPRHVHAG